MQPHPQANLSFASERRKLGTKRNSMRPEVKWQKSPRSAKKCPKQLFEESLLFLRGSGNISGVRISLRSIVDGRNEMWLPLFFYFLFG